MFDDSLNPEPDELENKAYNAAIALLARREYSQKELTDKLFKKFCSAEGDILNTVIQRLTENSYLSDERFAEAYCRARVRKGFGLERLLLELAEKGICTELGEQVLIQFEEQWLTLVEQVWRKKYKTLPQNYAEKAKQQNFLRYRGFTFSDIDRLFTYLKFEDNT
ncbi:regulatory protein RecX [Teredinibacter haidensis]|uniref:regulatory protein RecX n=1 Tax=Teredinibacter haidensis TaxID=2731755 RepID=UPI000948F26C|nr:regulatory protein RecX [Teredinibacter haidensis]